MRVAIVPAGVLLLLGCVSTPVGELREESRSVELGGAELASAEIEMKAGELRVSGGAAQLLDATFYYNDDRWKPEVKYSVSGFRGRLVVRQPSVTRTIGRTGDFRHEWDLRLNNDVPLDLEVRLGAGKSILKLGDLHLRSLEIHVGAGELDLDLTGKWRKDLEARIRGGVGQATVRVPGDVGVRAEARGALGEIHARGFRKSGHVYTNDAYRKSPVALDLDIRGGIGQIRLELE